MLSYDWVIRHNDDDRFLLLDYSGVDEYGVSNVTIFWSNREEDAMRFFSKDQATMFLYREKQHCVNTRVVMHTFTNE